MSRPVLLFLFSLGCFAVAEILFGYWPVYEVSYGAFSLLAAVISGTFLWLWYRRSTPLALGMAFGWGGASSVMAWWWLYNLLGRPEAMAENAVLYFFLSAYFVGAVLHLDVIGRSFGLSRTMAMAPLAAALLVSTGLALVL